MKRKQESPLNSDLFGSPEGSKKEASTQSRDREDPPNPHKEDDGTVEEDGESTVVNSNDKTAAMNNVTPVKKVRDETPPKLPTLDRGTLMFQTYPISSDSYSTWNEYFDEKWECQPT